MDWTLAHALNGSLRGHGAAQALVEAFASWSVPLFAAATFALLLSPRLRGACVRALAAAALALGVNQAIGRLWFRERPFAAHPATLLLAAPSGDPSFPSDHAAAAFAIAVSVALASRRLGAAFLAAAAAIAVSRVAVGLHYPSDVLAGAAIGAGAAVAATLARRWPRRPPRRSTSS